MPPETEAARLYDTIGASLFRHALMILANREAAEDVIQQVFLALLDGRAGRIEDEKRFLRRSRRYTEVSLLIALNAGIILTAGRRWRLDRFKGSGVQRFKGAGSEAQESGFRRSVHGFCGSDQASI